MADGNARRSSRPWGEQGQDREPFTQVHRTFRRLLEHSQDVIVIGLAAILFALMIRSLATLAEQVIAPTVDFRPVLGQTLFMMVLIELLRLLVVYLGQHYVAVDVMVETSIVATLREVILKGAADLPPATLLAVAAFVIVLGLLLRFGDLRVGNTAPSAAETSPPARDRRGHPTESSVT